MAQLLSNLPLGAKIKLGKHQIKSETALPIIWRIVDKNHSGYPANSATLMTDSIIDLRCHDSGESSWTEEPTPIYGYYNYKVSNLHQWLNSEAAAGEWYTAQHTNDKPPTSNNTASGTQYQSRPGFLYNFTFDEKLALLPTTLTNQHASNVSTTMVAKVFLASLWEILGTHSVADGSTKFAYFNTNTASATVTAQVIANSSSSQKPTSTTAYWTYWTRSTQAKGACLVTESGSGSYEDPYVGKIGVRPCVNILTTTKVTDTVDSDGCYTILAQNAPTISGSNTDLGTLKAGFTRTYSVSDVDNEPVTVTEYIDNVKIRSYVATLGATNTFAITGNTWLKLANGNHTLKITATDGFDTATRTYTFVKSVTTLVAQRATPLDSATQPKSIFVTVVKNIPEGATFKVEACNNGYDASPVWEDITSRVLQGRIYDFTNAAKTAGKWGVNIRVTVDRNGKEGACYITEIGGNFE